MRWPHLLVYVYGAFLAVLGVIGGLGLGGHKPSPMSFAGLLFGAVVIWFGMTIPKAPRRGYIGTTVIALLNAIQFVPKFHGPEGRLFPHGFIAYFSVAVIILLSAAHLMSKQSAKSAVEAG